MIDIVTISDLINELIKIEKEKIESFNIRHPVLIGDMYEGLTVDILKMAIFKDLNLHIVKNSQIYGLENKEFDVMLVEGQGINLPHTNSYIYNIEKVIAIFQVKKNLYSKDIQDGYFNLASLSKYSFDKILSDDQFKMARDATLSILQKDVFDMEKNNLSPEENCIYNCLKRDVLLPIRIIFGYNGFKQENKLRESFLHFLEQHISTADNDIKGFGPKNYPNLIICNNYSIIKINGMPYCPPFSADEWAILFTSRFNPLYIMLEIIWTKLSYRYSLPCDIFGED